MTDWIPIEKEPEEAFLKVKYQFEDLTEDIGVWQMNSFYVWDSNKDVSKIINWKPFEA